MSLVSPAMTSRFFTIVPPGKSQLKIYRTQIVAFIIWNWGILCVLKIFVWLRNQGHPNKRYYFWKGKETSTLHLKFIASSETRVLSRACASAGFPAGSVVKNLAAKQEREVRSLGWADPLEEEMASHTSIPAWEIPWTGGACWASAHRGTDSCTQLSD